VSGVGWLVVAGAFTLIAGQFWLLYRARAVQGWPAPEFSRLKPDGVDAEWWLLYFFHSGCPHCRQQTPLLEELAAEDPRVLLVDTHQEPELAAAFRVRVTPTIMRVHDGTIDRVLVGQQSRRRLRRLLETRR
jgi:thioredoxin 1